MNEIQIQYLSPVIKVVSAGCNLRCGYCFYSGNQPEIKKMSIDILEVLTEKFLEGTKFVRFIWHGGEPTIMGTDFYRKAIEIQKKLKRPSQVIKNSIQTNATLLDNKWIDFIQERNISPGISLDGPRQLHNITRKNANGQGSFDQVVEGMELLRQAKITFRPIAVVNSKTVDCPEEIFWFFYNLGLSFSVNMCTSFPSDPDDVKKLAISPMQYAKFLARLLELWLDLDDENFRIRPLEDIVRGMFNRRVGLCRYEGICSTYITIDSNGDVYPCDEFLNEEFLLGNLVERSLSEVYSSRKLQNYYSGRADMWAVCRQCEWFNTCKGGCMREWKGRKSLHNPETEEFCQARKFIFEKTQKTLRALEYEL